MPVDISEDFEFFRLPSVDPDDPAAARAAITASLAETGHPPPPPQLDDAALVALEPSVLFAYQDDYYADFSLYAIPKSHLSDALLAAFERADGKAYAWEEMQLGDDNARAYLRIDAAVDQESIRDILDDLDFEQPGFIQIPEDERAFLEPFRVARFENGEEPVYQPDALDRRFVATYTVRRAQ